VTPTGLVLWPVRGPVSRLAARTAHWPSCLAEDHRDLTERPTSEDLRRPLSVWRPCPDEYCARGIRGSVPCRFRLRPPALGTNPGGSTIGIADRTAS